GAAATFALLQPSAAPARDVARFELTGPASLPLAEAPLAHTLAISPDGRRIAYGSADGSLTVRPLEALELTRLPRLGTEVRSPVFSLDGRFIAFFDDRALNVVSARGGSPVSWAELDSRPWGAAFAPDGSIVVAGAGGLARVPSGGGVPEVLTPLDAARGEHAFDAPALLPRRRAVLFAIRTAKRGGRARIAVLDLATRTRKELLDHGTQPRYLPPGHLVYAHASTL